MLKPGLIIVFSCILCSVSYAQEAQNLPVLQLEPVPDTGFVEQVEVTAEDMGKIIEGIAEGEDIVFAPDPEAAAAASEPLIDTSASLPEKIEETIVETVHPYDERFEDEEEALEAIKNEMPAIQDKDAEDNITVKESLTDTIKENSSEEIAKPEAGTWIDKLKDTGKKVVSGSASGADSESLEGMVAKSKKEKTTGSNAAVFDISGIMLRMSLAQVERTLENRGFRKMSENWEIPNFIKWRNEETCRNNGVVGYERLGNCVIKLAKNGNYHYVETVRYSKFDTKEDIEVYFTSNFTNNKVYKIIYKSLAPAITGNSPQALYTRNVKVYDFWKVINQKYGRPDNTQDVIWGMGDNKPYLRASTGYLLLEDPMLRELDYTRMSREDQRYMNTNLYSF